jgi:NAD(P)-dependent dehydrogenase (short-subunit alcohol dehydrogenase family)
MAFGMITEKTMNTASMQTETQSTEAPLPYSSLHGKKVLVVGGKTGIGLGIARAARAAGASVLVASRRLSSVAEHPELDGFEQIVLDMRDESAVQHAFDAIGHLDHLVITAAPDLGSWGKFMDADMSGVRHYIEGKFLGTWACARYGAPHMAAGGSITFLTGGTAARHKPGFAAVTSTFAAVEALSGSLALELGPIRVNTIRPGYVDTDMWNVMPKEERDALRQRVRDTFPARHAGTTADIGHAALFLMTNAYVTGTVVEVSGGENLVPSVF